MSGVSDMGESSGIQGFGPDRDSHRFLYATAGARSWSSPIGNGSGGGHVATVPPGRHALAQPDGHPGSGQWLNAPTLSSAVSPWSFGFHWFASCLDGFVTDALVLCNDLSAQEQDQSSDFHAQQDRDGGGEGAVDHLDLGHARVIPNENMAGDFPQQGGRCSADQRMTQRQSSNGHNEVDGREQQEFSCYAEGRAALRRAGQASGLGPRP